MDGLTCAEIVVKSWRVYTRKSNMSVRWKQRSLYILWNCFIVLAKNTKYFTRCYANLARSVRSDWKVGSFASGSIYKICRMRHAETFVIGNEKVHTSSSAEILLSGNNIQWHLASWKQKLYETKERKEQIYFSAILFLVLFHCIKMFCLLKK